MLKALEVGQNTQFKITQTAAEQFHFANLASRGPTFTSECVNLRSFSKRDRVVRRDLPFIDNCTFVK